MTKEAEVNFGSHASLLLYPSLYWLFGMSFISTTGINKIQFTLEHPTKDISREAKKFSSFGVFLSALLLMPFLPTSSVFA